MLKVLIVITSHALLGSSGQSTGYYLSEVTHPYSELKQAGLQVDIASIQGGKAPVVQDSLDMKDPINKEFWETPATRALLNNTIALKNVDPKAYAGVLFAGGHGTMWDFRGNAEVARVTREIYERGGSVAAVCHGPAALVGLKLSNGDFLVKGKKVAAFTNAEEEAVKLTKIVPFQLETELRNNGALFEGAALWKSNVRSDQRLITGQNPASASLVGRELVASIKKEIAKASSK